MMFGNVSPHGLGFPFPVEPVVVKPVGLKLEVSPEITPRDSTIGMKIFTMVPSDARSVRDVKAHLANVVLKTPVPFHIFMGEYRIREEEDVQIFSLINEPCRLVPVPKPRPALSSTPKVKLPKVNGCVPGPSKRVTFFDSDWSTSPVERCEGMRNNEMAGDVLDHPHLLSPRQTIIPSPRQFLATPTPILTPIGTIPLPSNGTAVPLQDAVEGGSSEERKKRRRRRHRKRKSKSGSGSQTQSDEEDDDAHSETEPVDGTHHPTEAGSNCASAVNKGSISRRKASLEVLNEDTESEEETIKVLQKSNDPSEFDFDFVTPSTAPKVGKRPIKTDVAESGIKKKKLSDSAFSSPGSFLSPTPMDDTKSSGSTRQDTPLPRVIRNPRFFDTARKIINDFGIDDDDRRNSNEGIGEQTTANTDSKAYAKSQIDNRQMPVDEKNYRYYSLCKVNSLEEVKVCDKIAFRILELDERYNPRVSDFKEGIIIGKAGNELTIQYTKNDAVVRNGKYELQLEEGESDDAQRESDAKPVILHFAELVEPKLLETRL